MSVIDLFGFASMFSTVYVCVCVCGLVSSCVHAGTCLSLGARC